MSNGDIDEAQLEAILASGQPAVNRYVATGVFQLTRSVGRIAETCEQRGKTCPAVVSTRTLRSVAGRIVDRVALPIVVVLLTILATRMLG